MAIPRYSERPIAEALADLRREDPQRRSMRALARDTAELDPEGRGITGATISVLLKGKVVGPTEQTMEWLAEAHGVEPEYFAEYRIAQQRRLLDPAEGFDRALTLAGDLERLAAKRSAEARGRGAE